MANEVTTQVKVAKFEAIMPLLEAMFRDFQDLSKKKPDGALNKSKVKIANRLLTDVLVILDGEPNREYLELFDEESLPQYSDVVLMLGQTVAAMERFKRRYYEYTGGLSNDGARALSPAKGRKANTRELPRNTA
jgi:hypothetical protein